MDGNVSVVGWKAASEIAKHLVDAGYEVLITSDGFKIHDDIDGQKELAYQVAFAHPEYAGSYFELVNEDQNLRNWDQIKAEMEADVAEGIADDWEPLDEQTKPEDLTKKKKKKE